MPISGHFSCPICAQADAAAGITVFRVLERITKTGGTLGAY
jgi:hypothetical protein